jgi:glycosyltransferase involved in cell wall biosynthesis
MQRKLKICLASMAPFPGGAEIALERLALGLRQAGHEVLVVLGTQGEVLERLSAAGHRCLHSPMTLTDRWHPWRYWSARNRLRRLLRREAPDIIHSNDLPTHQIVSDAARGLGIPRICHHRFVYGGRCIDWLNKFGAERQLFISHSLKEYLTSQSRDLKEASGAVVYDGLPIPPLPSRQDRLDARRQLGLSPGRSLMLFAGQVVEVKGVADLLRAWSLLMPRWRDRAELLIVGDDLQKQGAYRRQMDSLARELDCPIRFVGFQQDVQRWQTAADIAVVPSHVEPLGLVALEAMSLGLPVVGCAVGGICETVCDGVTGLLVPPRSPDQLAAALERLLQDEGMRAEFGSAGRQRCEDLFSLEAHVGKVVSEYMRLSGAQEGWGAARVLA